MKEKYIQALGILMTTVYTLFVVFLYWAEPKSLTEVPGKAKTSIENAATRGQVMIGTYEIDRAKFDEGLTAFRQDNFLVARDRFEKADPEKRDANTQYYIAYSLYRQGWGRLSNDDELFKKGLEQVNLVMTLDPNFRSADDNLQLKSPVELKNEFEEGLKVTASDFNPMRLVRERK
jgi:hypothetical protein